MKHKFTYIVVILFLFSLAGCDQGFEKLNIDPTQSTNLDPNIQLSKIQLEIAGNGYLSEIIDLYMLRPFMQHMNGSFATRNGSLYIKKNIWTRDYWGFYYTSTLKNLVDLIERTKDDTQFNNINAIGRILKVYQFSKLTDLYGDIPYFQGARAFHGDILNATYDPQKVIYEDFFKELKEAVTILGTNSGLTITGDYYYEGDLEKWKKFANSLRLRLALRLSKVDPEKGRKEAAEAFDAGVMTSNEDICLMNYGNFPLNDVRANPLSNAFQQNPRAGGNKLTTTLVNYMKTNADPRLTIYGRAYDWTETEDVTRFAGIQGLEPGMVWFDYQFVESGKEYTDPNTLETMVLKGATDIATVSKSINNQIAPMLLFTYSETAFLVAEAAARGWINANTGQFYRNGLRAGVQQMTLYPDVFPINNADLTTFVDTNPLLLGREIEIINSQKWVLLFLDEIEAFANWRRSGFPKLIPTNNALSSNPGVIPRRFEYPDSEYLFNYDNVQEAISRIGQDDWTKRVWWDTNE